MSLFGPATLPPDVRLICGDTSDMLAMLRRDRRASRLIVADPPWVYDQKPGASGHAGLHYQTLPLTAEDGAPSIVSHIGTAGRLAAPGARLAVWATWPFLTPFVLAMAAASSPWRAVTGGAWYKDTSAQGIGQHWLGRTEPVLIYRTEGTLHTDTAIPLHNGHVSPSQAHSEKPVAWMRDWLRRWTAPGDLVVDLYAGLGTVAQAAVLEGRGYLGAEIDPARHAEATERIGYAARQRK